MTATVHGPDIESDDAGSYPTQAAPRWPGFALACLLAATATLYLWNLSANGYANAFYAAAAQSGARNWKAWFFGSLDPNNFITVDKPPAALWVTGLSVRFFGMNSWAVLVPQALMGVAAVGVLYATVRRTVADPRHGAVAGLIAGTVLAVTPAATLMFRYNNPDALMMLLITIGAYFLVRAVATASWRWLALVGVALGFAFLTKMLAGLLVLPAFALAYLLFAPTGWGRRVLHLLGAGLALVVAAGWWVAVVQLWPADSRPYIGGSTDNHVLNLALGYNGVSRVVGGGDRVEHGPVPSGHGSGWAARAGWSRIFSAEMGYEASWLVPVVVFVIGFGIYLAVRGVRLSRDEKAALVMWTLWFLVSALVFSYMTGLAHPYYTIALAPAIGALVGLGSAWAWRVRAGWDGKLAISVMVLLAAGWAIILLKRAGLGPVWTRWTIGAAAVIAVVLLIAAATRWPRLTPIATVVAMLAGLSGTTAFALATAATPHNGSIPNAAHTANVWPTVGPRFGQTSTIGAGPSRIDPQLAEVLAATRTTWSAATQGSQSAASLEIASGTAVMAIGGWSSDPVPTLQRFIDDVHAGKISYYVESGRLRARDQSAAGEIADWVARHYRPTKVGGTTVYRLL